jgi:hypothetical protein
MRMSVDVTFDPAHGYVGTAPERRSAVRALSLNGVQGPSVPENRSPEHSQAPFICRAPAARLAAISGDEQMFGAE